MKIMSDELQIEGKPIEVWAIAGNHDTRISGLIPLTWLVRFALGSALFGYIFLRAAKSIAAHNRVFLWIAIFIFRRDNCTDRSIFDASGFNVRA